MSVSVSVWVCVRGGVLHGVGFLSTFHDTFQGQSAAVYISTQYNESNLSRVIPVLVTGLLSGLRHGQQNLSCVVKLGGDIHLITEELYSLKRVVGRTPIEGGGWSVSVADLL